MESKFKLQYKNNIHEIFKYLEFLFKKKSVD